MSERRMNAYYYSFEPTYVDAVDIVLSAVACAGKAFHRTSDWSDESPAYNPEHRGATPVEWIQYAAEDAAEAFSRLQEQHQRELAAAAEQARKEERRRIYDLVDARHAAAERYGNACAPVRAELCEIAKIVDSWGDRK